MNKFKKLSKIISVCLVLATMLAAMPGFAAPRSASGGVLVGMGIADSAKYAADESVSRIDFVELTLAMLGADKNMYARGENRIFFDVDPEATIARTVSAAYALGLIKGGDDGYLRPDSVISEEEALYITARALGGDEVVSLCGGVYRFADRFGLLKNVSVASDGTLTYKNAAEMMYNALASSAIEVDTNGNYTINSDSTLMGTLYGMKTAVGVLDTNYKCSLGGEAVTDYGSVLVDGKRYRVKNPMYNDMYLGYSVEIYYREVGGFDEIVYIDASDNDVLVIDADDVDSFAPGKVEYYANGGTKKYSEKLDIGAVTIKNNEKISVTGSLDIPDYGVFTLIDRGGNGTFDCTVIEAYEIKTFSHIGNDPQTLYFKNGGTAVCPDDYDKVFITDADGKSIEPSAAKAYDTVEICASANKKYLSAKVISDRKKITPSTVETDSDEGITTVYDADGNATETVKNFGETLRAGTAYEFSVDSHGRIVAIVSDNESSRFVIAYVVNAELDSPLSKDATVTVYNTDGKFVDYKAADKIKITNDGSRITVADLINRLPEQLIRLRAGEDMYITEIELASDSADYKGLRKVAVLPAARNISSRYYTGNMLMGGKFAVNSSSVIMMVPESDNRRYRDMYNIANSSYLRNQEYYPSSTGYKIGDETRYADVVVMRGLSGALNRDSGVMLISKVMRAMNEYGDTKTKFSGFVGGQAVDMMLSDDSLLKYTAADGTVVTVGEGDCIRYAVDYKNEICALKPVYDASESRMFGNGDGDDSGVAYGDPLVHRTGKVLMRRGQYLNMLLDGDTEDRGYLYPITKATALYSVTLMPDGSRKCEVITQNDIATLEDDGGLADRFFALLSYQNMLVLVIYK